MRPRLRASRPARSTLCPDPGSVDSGAAHAVTRKAKAPIGRLIQKIARQSTSTRMPPTSGPIASATAEMPAQMPSARGCSSAGNALQTIASESGSIGAAPMPCRTRPQIRVSSSPATADSTEPSAKMTVPTRYIRLRPNMSPSRPAVTTRTVIVSR